MEAYLAISRYFHGMMILYYSMNAIYKVFYL